MKLTFSKQNALSRKNLLWLYFIIIAIMAISLGAFIYYSVTNIEETKPRESSSKINESELQTIGDFQYLGVPFDLSQGLGKKNPFGNK